MKHPYFTNIVGNSNPLNGQISKKSE